MNRYLVVLIAVVAVGLLAGGFFIKNSQDNKGVAGVTTAVSASRFEQIQQEIKNGAKFYDVRTLEEFTAGHFENAVNWPLQRIENGELPNIAKDSKIYLYCRSGNRSGQATVILNKAGYTNVTDLGGLTDVKGIGGKLVTN